MATEETAAVAAPVLLGDVVSRIVSVLRTMRQETVHVSQAAYDAVSQEIERLEADAKSAGLTASNAHDVLGAVVAHLHMDPHNPLQPDISVAAPEVKTDTPA